jgi:Outer membrane protein beta-barrel family
MAQGYFVGMSSADIGIKKDFLKGLLNVSLSVSDVFNNLRFEVHTRGTRFDNATQTAYNTFQQDALRKRETQIVTLTASFRFGNIKPDNMRKRPRETDGGGMPDGGGM